jgi:hypothetical protein
VNIVLDSTRHRGRAIDVVDRVASPTELYRAVRRPSAVAASQAPSPRRLRVDCAAPTAIHEHVGKITPAIDVDVQMALAATARSWGETAPQREHLQEVREKLARIEVPSEDTRAARREVASAGADEQRLRESVAELRGRVQTLRETAPDSRQLEDAEAELAETARKLSEAETDRLAAEQRLAQAERTARRARDARERRLRLQDRVANLEREARATLADRAAPAFSDALETVPGSTAREARTATTAEPDAVTTALAIAKIADVEAPIVLASDRFDAADTAATWVDAPVIRVEVQTG